MTQEFHLSVTPIRENEYLVRTEDVAPGVPLGEEQVVWSVDEWLTEASLLMDDPLMGLLRSGASFSESFNRENGTPRFQVPHRPGNSTANLVTFGQRLYNALFQGTIRDSWMMAQGIAQHRREVLRLRLGLKGTDLHRLPWEVLYAGDRPLASGTDIVFSRYHSSFSILKSQVRFQKGWTGQPGQPLKILMVLAAPTDQEVLSLKQEAENLQQELQRTVGASNSQAPDVELTILEQPGREQLTQALEHNHYQVLHYAGHSNLGAAGGNLYLVSRRTGLTEVLSGDDLAGLLVNNGIRMAVFNSCRGVYTATSDSASDTGAGNLAEALVRRGIPAVLAMAERIPDNVALHLSRLFYRNLKQAYPVDLSLSRARQGLISSYGSDQLYWALPILYLHPDFDGYLLPPVAAPNSYSLPVESRMAQGLYDDFSSPTVLEFPVATNRESVMSINGRSWRPSDSGTGTYQDIEADFYDDDERSPALDSDHFPEFEELEFEDPEAEDEDEKTKKILNDLSQTPTFLEPDDSILPASPGESLLPALTSEELSGDEYLRSLQPSHQQASASSDGQPSTSTAIAVDDSDTNVYSELAQVLKDMGKLTEEIAASIDKVQSNPTTAKAYTDLGWVLYEQGHLVEAIAAYKQAIRLDPNDASTHNRLGLALYQQGKPDQSIQSYNRAIQLDPTLTDAATNLRAALGTQRYSQTNPQTADAQPERSKDETKRSPFFSARKPRSGLFWIGLGAITASAILGTWLFYDDLSRVIPSILPIPGASPSPTDDLAGLQRLETNALVTLATEQLQQGKIATSQTAIAALLNRRKLTEAAAVLKSVPNQYAQDPTFNFLNGRLAWEFWLAGSKDAENKSYSASEARQFWETAAKGQPSALHHNALGFAYYAEGKLEQAGQAWLQALRPSDAESSAPAQPQSSPSPNPEVLTARAGLAMVWLKRAEQSPVTEQAVWRSKALELRQQVLAEDEVNFRPEILQKNWMWSDKAIQDWRSLLATK